MEGGRFLGKRDWLMDDTQNKNARCWRKEIFGERAMENPAVILLRQIKVFWRC